MSQYSMLYRSMYAAVRDMLRTGVEPVVILDTMLAITDADEPGLHPDDALRLRRAGRAGLADGLATPHLADARLQTIAEAHGLVATPA
jgi:hypothetical protein